MQHQPDPDDQQPSPAAAIRGAPNRSLKKTAPMAAPTMTEASPSAAADSIQVLRLRSQDAPAGSPRPCCAGPDQPV